MTKEQIILQIAQLHGDISPAQDRVKIEAAIAGALEEYGVNVNITQAQETISRTIAAEDFEIRVPSTNYRIVSCTYIYASGSQTRRRPLVHREKTTFDELTRTRDIDNTSTDAISYYTIVGDKLQVGIGRVLTGGTIEIIYQRKLQDRDIAYIPNGMAIVYGALAIMVPEAYKSERYRTKFVQSFKKDETVDRPVMEHIDCIPLNENIQANISRMDEY